MTSRRYVCPECDVVALSSPEVKGAIHLDCPVCQAGSVFRDARGGYECSACDQRFLVHETPPAGVYGGPPHAGGPLRWWERPWTGWAALTACSLTGLVLCLIPVRYWTLLFFVSLGVERWRKKDLAR